MNATPSSSHPVTVASSSAAPSLLGYSTQQTRLLFHLLRGSAGDLVALEVVGDTSVHQADGTVLTEESKVVTRGANPITDRAVPFWKTMANWVRASAEGAVVPDRTLFRLWVSKGFTPGHIAGRFHDASTPEDVAKALSLSAVTLGVEDGDYEGLSETLRPHVRTFMEAPEATRDAIIRRFEIDTGAGEAFQELRERLRERFVAEHALDPVVERLVGWVKVKTDTLLEAGQPAVLSWDDFREHATKVIARYNQEHILLSYAPEQLSLTEQDQASHLPRTYVRQLQLVLTEEDDFESILEAITDFLKAQIEEVEWAARGLVLEQSLSEFRKTLKGAWRNKRMIVEAAHKGVGDEARGRILLGECMQHKATLVALEPPAHFVPGTFHALADAQEIGWHPLSSTLLSVH